MCACLRINHNIFLQPLPIEVVGGLDDVQKGFELMKENKNTSKLVIKV